MEVAAFVNANGPWCSYQAECGGGAAHRHRLVDLRGVVAAGHGSSVRDWVEARRPRHVRRAKRDQVGSYFARFLNTQALKVPLPLPLTPPTAASLGKYL